MAQHDYNIANDTAANVRADLNNVLAAIVSNNSGATAPSTTYANQWWYDSSNNILKIRNEADTAWIDFATLDQTNSVWKFPTDATPDTDSTYDLGESSLKWANLYVDNVSDGTTSVGTEYVVNGSAKAWANLNQSVTLTANDSFNMSSFTDNSTGVGTSSYTNNMSNANYSVSGMSTNSLITQTSALTTSSFQHVVRSGVGTGVVDTGRICMSMDGDLA